MYQIKNKKKDQSKYTAVQHEMMKKIKYSTPTLQIIINKQRYHSVSNKSKNLITVSHCIIHFEMEL